MRVSSSEKIWVIKVPTALDPHIINPTEAYNHEYTMCSEKDSMYGGGYETSSFIVEYYTLNKKYIVVPYKHNQADHQYGFYEFSNKTNMKQWLLKNLDKTKFLQDTYPELFI